MALLISNVRVDSIELKRDGDEGIKFTATYALITPEGTVLAKQDINGYNSNMKLEMQGELGAAARLFSDALKKEIMDRLGIDAPKT